MKASELFTFPESLPFRDFFSPEDAPWHWIARIAEVLRAHDFSEAPPLPATLPAGLRIQGPVYLDPSVSLPPYGCIEGPVWIGAGCTMRPGVYLRGNVIAAPGTVLGHCCEYKNCLLLEGVETTHFNYIGDSVLGRGAHLGAGAICANLKLARDEISVRLWDGERVPTGLTKFGALLGDGAEVACNTVLQPGTILGRNSAVLTSPFHGTLAADSMALPEHSANRSNRIIEKPA